MKDIHKIFCCQSNSSNFCYLIVLSTSNVNFYPDSLLEVIQLLKCTAFPFATPQNNVAF